MHCGATAGPGRGSTPTNLRRPHRQITKWTAYPAMYPRRLPIGFMSKGIRRWRRHIESFGILLKERGPRANAALGVVWRLREGESVSLKSGIFNLRQVKISPQPTQKPNPPIWLGWVHAGRAPTRG